MATYRKPLKDINGDYIIPVVPELDDKVDIASTDITDYSGTILALVKGIYPEGYHRWFTRTDGGTANITDKPTGSTNNGFVLEAFKSRDNTTTDYSYRVVCRTFNTKDTYEGNVGYSTSSLTWVKTTSDGGILSATAVRDAGWSADKAKIPDMSVLAYWNGAYSGTNSNLKYFASNSVTNANLQDGSITTPKFSNFNTTNTVDTWVPVAANGDIQHRVIKPFNADGSIPRSAMGFETPKIAVVNSNNGNSGYWKNLGTLSAAIHQQGEFVYMKIFIGNGNNGRNDQNAYIELTGQKGWTGSLDGRYGWSAVLHPMNSPFTTSNTAIRVIATDYLNYNIWIQASATYVRPNILFYPTMKADGSGDVDNTTFTPSSSAWQSGAPSGTACAISYQQAAL